MKNKLKKIFFLPVQAPILLLGLGCVKLTSSIVSYLDRLEEKPQEKLSDQEKLLLNSLRKLKH